VDQVPLAFWRHFHREDRDPAALAQAGADLARRYDLDLVKETHESSPDTETGAPYLARPAVAEPEGWRVLRQHGTAALERELEGVRITRAQLGQDWPLVMTVFSPLTLAYKLAGERLAEHLRADPEAVHVGLRKLTAVSTGFAHAALDAGADGLFLASQWMCAGFCTREQYEAFGLAYDLEVLEAATSRSRLTVLHLHGSDVFFDLVEDYPVDALSWHDRETPPSLAQARERTDLAFMTGLDRDLLRAGPREAIAAQVRDAIAQTEGRGLILAPACVMHPDTPEDHLQAVVDALQR
jgi:uroporphyrinogen decarboxylase